MTLSKYDRDILIRTIIGEAANEGPEGWAGVAHTIRNRSLDSRWPSGVADVSLQPKQFSAWNKGAGGNHLVHKYGPDSGVYQNVGKIADQVFTGEYDDPTGGATHYYSPAGMKALVNSGAQSNVLPRWLQNETDRRGGDTVTIGGHIFTGRANNAAPATGRSGMLSDEAVGASYRQPTPSIGQEPAKTADPAYAMAFAPQAKPKIFDQVPFPEASPLSNLGSDSSAAPVQQQPMKSMKPGIPQGQTASLAPTVAQGGAMPKTSSTTIAPTPQQIAQRQAMANALAEQADGIEVIRHPLQGVDKMAKSALSGYQMMRAGQQKQARAQALSGVIGGMAGSQSYSQQQIAQAAAIDPQLGMRMVEANRAQETQIAEQRKAANTPKTMQIFDETTGRPMMARVFPDGRVEPLGGVKSDTVSPEAEKQKARIAAAGRSETNVTVGPDGRMGKIPQGHVVVEDPTNEAGVKAVPIPGTPAAMDVQKVQDAQAAKTAATERSGSVVLQDIDRTLDLMRGEGFLPTTGTMGGLLSNISGTDAYDAGQLIQTISANTGFDRLQAMRDSSPTGGALGAINQTEMKLLQSALGNLNQYQSKEQIVDNLNRVRNIYLDIIHGPGSGPERRALSFDQPAQDDDFTNMTDEQLEAIANGR